MGLAKHYFVVGHEVFFIGILTWMPGFWPGRKSWAKKTPPDCKSDRASWHVQTTRTALPENWKRLTSTGDSPRRPGSRRPPPRRTGCGTGCGTPCSRPSCSTWRSCTPRGPARSGTRGPPPSARGGGSTPARSRCGRRRPGNCKDPSVLLLCYSASNISLWCQLFCLGEKMSLAVVFFFVFIFPDYFCLFRSTRWVLEGRKEDRHQTVI